MGGRCKMDIAGGQAGGEGGAWCVFFPFSNLPHAAPACAQPGTATPLHHTHITNHHLPALSTAPNQRAHSNTSAILISHPPPIYPAQQDHGGSKVGHPAAIMFAVNGPEGKCVK